MFASSVSTFVKIFRLSVFPASMICAPHSIFTCIGTVSVVPRKLIFSGFVTLTSYFLYIAATP